MFGFFKKKSMSKEDLHELIHRCLQQSPQYDDKKKEKKISVFQNTLISLVKINS